MPRLLARLGTDPASRQVIALALRTRRRETPAFKLLYRAFRLFRMLTGSVVNSGNYAAYRGWLAKQVIGHPYFDMSYSATLISLDVRREMVPCERGDRYAGQSRMNSGRLEGGASDDVAFPDLPRVANRALYAVGWTTQAVRHIVPVGTSLFAVLERQGAS